MRVVLLNQYYAPDEAATAQMLADLGEGLAAAGHEVSAVCCRRSYADPSSRYPRRERIRGVSIHRAWSTAFGRGSSLGRISDYLTFLAGAARVLFFHRRPDVVISLSTPPLVATLGLLSARLRGARSIFWVMDVYPDLAFELGVLRRGSPAGRLFSAISRLTLRRSDRVVALGESMAARLGSDGLDNVSVVHNWADGDAIRPLPPEGHPLRRDWGWSDRFVVLYSGNMGLAHEFETALDAAELLREVPDILFALVGTGPRRGEVEESVRRRGLNNVEFRAPVPRADLGHSLTAGNVHLVTLRDSLPGLLVPSKIYGILAAGRPTLYVGPEAGEIFDIIRSGDCGSRIAPGDAAGLADTILRYREDRQRGAREGGNARRLFESRFDKARGLEAFERIIRNDLECRSGC